MRPMGWNLVLILKILVTKGLEWFVRSPDCIDSAADFHYQGNDAKITLFGKRRSIGLFLS